jgi:hypothetical protein
MHYTAMLCYGGLCDVAAAEREEKLLRRFKADNEWRAVHDHESVALGAGK